MPAAKHMQNHFTLVLKLSVEESRIWRKTMAGCHKTHVMGVTAKSYKHSTQCLIIHITLLVANDNDWLYVDRRSIALRLKDAHSTTLIAEDWTTAIHEPLTGGVEWWKCNCNTKLYCATSCTSLPLFLLLANACKGLHIWTMFTVTHVDDSGH